MKENNNRKKLLIVVIFITVFIIFLFNNKNLESESHSQNKESLKNNVTTDTVDNFEVEDKYNLNLEDESWLDGYKGVKIDVPTKIYTYNQKLSVGNVIDVVEEDKIVYNNQNKDITNNYSIYNWNTIPLFDYNILETVKVLKELKVDSIYNSFDEETIISKAAKNIISTMTKNDIKTYSLMGNPDWYDDPDIVINKIDNLIEYNSKVSNKEKIVGIVLDIEPYVLADFENDSVNNFVKYVSTMKTIYNYVNDNGLELVTTIPYWYDEKYLNNENYSEEEIEKAKDALKVLFKNTDRISIMNFYKSTMINAINYEVSLAKELGKEIESIAEFQRPTDDGGIPEEISLWVEDDPIEYANDKWEGINNKYNYDNITFSYHDLLTILEIKGLYEKNIFEFIDSSSNSLNEIEFIVKFPDGSSKKLKYGNEMVLPKNQRYEILLPGCEILSSEKISLGDNILKRIFTVNRLSENILEIYPKVYNGTEYVSIDSGIISLINEENGIMKTANITSDMYAVFFGVYSNLEYKVVVQDALGNNYVFESATAKADDGTFKTISNVDGNLVIPQGFRADSYIVPTFYLK